MDEWLTWILSGPAGGISAAGSGFAGSMLLLWASWRSIGIREALLQVEAVKTDGPAFEDVAIILSTKLNRDQLEKIRGERRYYLAGVALLAVSFALSFLRELV